jgi:hypothetical protein
MYIATYDVNTVYGGRTLYTGVERWEESTWFEKHLPDRVPGRRVEPGSESTLAMTCHLARR